MSSVAPDYFPPHDMLPGPALAQTHPEELANMPYQHPRHAVLRPFEIGHFTFSSGGLAGVNLADAFEGHLAGLDAPDDTLLPAGFRRVTIRIHMPGHRPFRRVKNIQRVCRGAPLPTPRHRVVQSIAEAARMFVAQAQDLAVGSASAFGAGAIELRDLYLLALHRYGRTLVPVFGYMRWNGQAAMPAEGGGQGTTVSAWDFFLDNTQSQ